MSDPSSGYIQNLNSITASLVQGTRLLPVYSSLLTDTGFLPCPPILFIFNKAIESDPSKIDVRSWNFSAWILPRAFQLTWSQSQGIMVAERPLVSCGLFLPSDLVSCFPLSLHCSGCPDRSDTPRNSGPFSYSPLFCALTPESLMAKVHMSEFASPELKTVPATWQVVGWMLKSFWG